MSPSKTVQSGAWRELEISFEATSRFTQPYTEVEFWADFVHDSGLVIRRPGFWDGDNTWRLRFASPMDRGEWRWSTGGTVEDAGLQKVGVISMTPAPEPPNRFHRRGFWRMSSAGRSLVHADGRPAILVADTAWALPWRATDTQARTYAEARRAQGFNAALLMSVQPDMRAQGPRDRTQDGGFDVGFTDLPSGTLNDLNPAYFQYLDRLLSILVDHELVPVLQPVFQGFGWKGLSVAGTVVSPAQYARYCRYLVARYGARPAIWLVGADGSGREPQIEAGGREVHAWDAYGQPTGVHYRPHADNRAHQGEPWLDFQWCQTGHTGAHVAERVADMWRNQPSRAVANGEPTYEGTRRADMAAGWWQGHEAWSNLCAGGTMGVVYGAASLWQWRLHGEEPGHEPYFLADSGGWREALDREGSRYVGLISRILEGLPTTDMEPDWQTFLSPRGLRAGSRLCIVYQDGGGRLVVLNDHDLPSRYRVVDPRTGQTLQTGERQRGVPLLDDDTAPRVVIFCDEDCE